MKTRSAIRFKCPLLKVLKLTQELPGLSCSAKDATRKLHALDGGAMDLRVECCAAISQKQAFIATIIGLAHRGVNTNVGRNSAKDQIADPR